MAITIPQYQTSQPVPVPAGSIITVTPLAGATAVVEYTRGSVIDIANGSAIWTFWPKGILTRAAADLLVKVAFVRVTAQAGSVTLDVNATPSAADLAAFYADWGAPAAGIVNASGNTTGLKVGAATIPIGPLGGGSTIAVLGNSIVALTNLNNSATNTSWNIGAAYTAASSVLTPSSSIYPDGTIKTLVFNCIQTGVSAATWDKEPVWPTTIGATVNDGTCIWQCAAGTDLNIANGAYADWWHITQYLGGNPLRPVFLGGLSGKRCADIYAKLPYVLSLKPDYIFMGHWLENDIWGGAPGTIASIGAAWTLYKSALDQVISLGIVPIIVTPFPSGYIDAGGALFSGYVSGIGTKSWNWLCGKIREYVSQNRTKVIFVDEANGHNDPAIATSTNAPVWPENTTTYLSSSGSGQLLKKTEGIHPFWGTSYPYAVKLAAAIKAFVGVQPTFAGGSGDVFNPAINPLNQGTTGTKGAGAITGTVPASMTLNAYGTTGAVTTSLIDRMPLEGISGNWFRNVYTATAGDNLSYNGGGPLAALGLAIGDIIEVIQEIRVLANPTLLVAPGLQVRFIGATSPQYFFVNSNSPGTMQDQGQFITVDTIFQFRSEPIQIPPGTTDIQIYGKAYGRGSCSFTVDFGRQRISKYPYLPVFA